MNNWKASGKPQQKAPCKHRLRQAKAKAIKLMTKKLKKGVNQ